MITSNVCTHSNQVIISKGILLGWLQLQGDQTASVNVARVHLRYVYVNQGWRNFARIESFGNNDGNGNGNGNEKVTEN